MCAMTSLITRTGALRNKRMVLGREASEREACKSFTDNPAGREQLKHVSSGMFAQSATFFEWPVSCSLTYCRGRRAKRQRDR